MLEYILADSATKIKKIYEKNLLRLKKLSFSNISCEEEFKKIKILFNSTSLQKIFFFFLPFLGIHSPLKIFLWFDLYIHFALFTLTFLVLINQKKTSVLIFLSCSIFPYLIHTMEDTLSPVPIIYLITLSFCFLDFSKKSKESNMFFFIFGSNIMFFLFIIEYFFIFKSTLTFSDLFQNKLSLGYDLTHQSKIFGNVHNVIPFIIGVFTLSLMNLNKYFIKKIAVINLSLAFLFCLIYISRFAILYMCFIFSIYFFARNFHKKNIKYLFAFLSIFTLCLFYFFDTSYIFAPIQDLLSGIFSSSKDQSTSDRIKAILVGLDILKENYIGGVGPGKYHLFDPVHTSPHNFIIRIIAENGIFGIVLTLQILFTAIFNIRNPKSLALLSFLFYSTSVGASLIDGRNCLNFVLLAFLIQSITSEHVSKRKEIIYETSAAKP